MTKFFKIPPELNTMKHNEESESLTFLFINGTFLSPERFFLPAGAEKSSYSSDKSPSLATFWRVFLRVTWGTFASARNPFSKPMRGPGISRLWDERGVRGHRRISLYEGKLKNKFPLSTVVRVVYVCQKIE